MARGIWENSLLKIFLTRGPLGIFFRPILYSREEQIHFSFLDPLTSYLTQGYVLSYLDRTLEVDQLFNETLNMPVNDLAAVIDSVYGSPNKVSHYRKIFNDKAEQDSPAADFIIHHYYAGELLRNLSSVATIDSILTRELSRQLRNLSIFASRKLQTARYNTLLMLEDMKPTGTHLS